MRAVIDRDGCIGCGTCADVCPDVFDLAEDGLACVLTEPTRGNAYLAHEAAESCPVQVIRIVE